MNNPGYVKCECWNCNTPIEFNSNAADEETGAPLIVCPNCFKDTQLYVPDAPLTGAALDFLISLNKQSVPIFISQRLRWICLSNGIPILSDDSVHSIIQKLFDKTNIV